MASVGLPSLQLVAALLLLSPGFITVKAVKYRGKVTEEIDRFDKAIYTVLASGISIAFVILAVSGLESQNASTTLSSSYPLWQISTGFLAACVIAGSSGWGLGWIIDERIYSEADNRKDTVWTLIFSHSEEPREVRVITTNDTEIHGYIYVNDSHPHGQDILLEYPQRIKRENGEITDKTSIGDYVFVSQADFSHIYFESNIDI